jgi:hypothetical protein
MAYNPCGTDEGHLPLLREMLKHIYRENERILGKVVFAAKCSVIAWYPTNDYYYGPAVLYTLFGDPALRIKRPLPTALSENHPRPMRVSELRVEPNPACGAVSVSYSLPSAANATVGLYDAAGELVRILDDGHRSGGVHRVRLDVQGLSSGLYFVRMTSSGQGTTSRPRFVKLVIP